MASKQVKSQTRKKKEPKEEKGAKNQPLQQLAQS